MRRPALLLAALAVAASGCGDDAGGGAGGEVRAVATTTIAGDLVRSVGGGRVDLDTLVPPNADPHDFEPRPSDAVALADADVVLESGGDLDEWLSELTDSAGGDAAEVTLLDSVRAIDDDPHWWQDPRNAILAVGAVRDALAEADPQGRRAYERNAAAYVRELRRLDAQIERCMRRVPRERRKLVTTHDSLGYFADRYDVEVIGAVIPSLSTQAQPSAKDVDALVEQIEDEGVEAIFPEVAVSQRLERAISRESGAEVGRELWTDGLGGEGSGAETYLDAMRANADALAQGMSGGRVSCGG
ncbi:MAG: metal ABC transporter substrate-binding protein [Thermoleophilaceae bacterium]